MYKKLFYKNGKKIIPSNINQLLDDELILAVWFMDDGYNRKDCRGLHLNTQSYSIGEQEILQECLRENFNLQVNIHKQSGKYKLYIPSRESKKFCNLIAQYVISSMRYKLL